MCLTCNMSTKASQTVDGWKWPTRHRFSLFISILYAILLSSVTPDRGSVNTSALISTLFLRAPPGETLLCRNALCGGP